MNVIISSSFHVSISNQGKNVEIVDDTFATLMDAKRFARSFARNYDKNHLTTYRIEVKYSDGDEGVIETGGFKNGKEFEY